MDHLAESESAALKSDTSGIRVPPPVYYVAAFLVGVALELIFPTSWPPFGVRLAAALLAGGAWLALDGAATVLFRRAGTSMVPRIAQARMLTIPAVPRLSGRSTIAAMTTGGRTCAST